jgi:hypothetical protein
MAAKLKITAEQWIECRAKREAGWSFPQLSKQYGISHQAIQKRAKAEKWGTGSNVDEVIRRKAAEKVAGIVAKESPEKREEALWTCVPSSCTGPWSSAGLACRPRQ